MEGEAGLVGRARDNARRNALANVEFHVADLAQPDARAPWLVGPYQKALLDPPRTGAAEIIPALAKLAPTRLLYVSCNPATLARDAAELVHTHGFELASAGVVDMFPHTAHLESMALFVGRR